MSVTRPVFDKHNATFYTKYQEYSIHEVLIVFASSPLLLQFVQRPKAGMYIRVYKYIGREEPRKWECDAEKKETKRMVFSG